MAQHSLPQLSYAFDAGNFNSLHNDVSLGGIFRQIDYFSEFGRYDGGNTSSNPQFHNGTYAGNFGWTPGASTSLRLTVRRVAAKVDVPNAIDFFGIPDDSFQTEDNTYIGATLQNQTTSTLAQSVALWRYAAELAVCESLAHRHT